MAAPTALCLLLLSAIYLPGLCSALNLANVPCGQQQLAMPRRDMTRPRQDPTGPQSQLTRLQSQLTQPQSQLTRPQSQLSRPRDARVLGGVAAYRGQLPWTVLVETEPGGGRGGFSGGVLISARHVLTSAHGLHLGARAADLGVVVGEHDRRERSAGKRRIAVERLTLHRFNTSTLQHDLALLRLAEPADWGPSVQPVCLPDRPVIADDATDAVPAVVAGWGWLHEPGVADAVPESAVSPAAEVLQVAQVPVISSARCRRWLRRYAAERGEVAAALTPGQLCAGHEDGGPDSCLGDSGGPLLVRDSKGQFSLAGIVSHGQGCGRRHSPGIYTDVYRYLDWIQRTMADQEESAKQGGLEEQHELDKQQKTARRVTATGP